jgi:hypothetical protein
VHAGLVGRHAEHTEKRRQAELAALAVASHRFVRVQIPSEDATLAVTDAEAVVQKRRPAARDRQAERADPYRLDPNLEHLAGLCRANLDRADQRVPVVEPGLAGLEAAALGTVASRRLEPPARIERREGNRVSGVDLEDRREIAGEVPVQRPPLERNLV